MEERGGNYLCFPREPLYVLCLREGRKATTHCKKLGSFLFRREKRKKGKLCWGKELLKGLAGKEELFPVFSITKGGGRYMTNGGTLRT